MKIRNRFIAPIIALVLALTLVFGAGAAAVTPSTQEAVVAQPTEATTVPTTTKDNAAMDNLFGSLFGSGENDAQDSQENAEQAGDVIKTVSSTLFAMFKELDTFLQAFAVFMNAFLVKLFANGFPLA
ncbi:MAG: hypothetical protein ACI4GB_04605 [Acutalibacteraceae bacterium]